MQLNLKSIFLSGEKLQKEYILDMRDFEWDDAKPFVSPIKVNVLAESCAGAVSLSITAEFDFEKPCDRCSADTTKHFVMKFSHKAVVSLSGEYSDEYIEVPDYILDVKSLVQADILLDLPHKFLCKDDCKGICLGCGENLNSSECKCSGEDFDPRLLALKQLLE